MCWPKPPNSGKGREHSLAEKERKKMDWRRANKEPPTWSSCEIVTVVQCL